MKDWEELISNYLFFIKVGNFQIKIMAKINYLKEPTARRESDWVLVGKIWPHKSKKNAFSGKFGIKNTNAAGQLVDVFSELTVAPGDPIMIRPNLNQRENKNDPSYLIYMLKKEVKNEKGA